MAGLLMNFYICLMKDTAFVERPFQNRIQFLSTDSGIESMGDSNTDISSLSDVDEEIERPWGFTEMFPESIRNIASNLLNVIVGTYSFVCDPTSSISAAVLWCIVFLHEKRINHQ